MSNPLSNSPFLSVGGFISFRVPSIISGKSLNAIFASYNRVGNYYSGRQDTGKNGLNVFVQNGYAITALLASELEGMSIERAMADAARTGQQIVDSELNEIPSNIESGTNTLLIIYGGLNAFGLCLSSIHAFRRKNPQATIVILTCDCDIDSKTPILHRIQTMGDVNDVIVTPYCGGQDQMGQILDALISGWPEQ